MGIWEKAVAGIFCFLLLSSVIVGGCVYLYKAISSDAVDAYKLKQAEADNAEILRIEAQRDAAIKELQSMEDMLRNVQGSNAHLTARQRALNQQLCRDHPESCSWKSKLPPDPRP